MLFFFVLSLVGVGIHSYLSYHHYQIKLGLSLGSSLCNITEKVSCDLTAASPYSEVFGVPVAVVGVLFHITLSAFALLALSGLTQRREFLIKSMVIMGAGSLVVSVLMAGISWIALKVYCPFCIAAYVISALIFWLALDVEKKYDPDGSSLTNGEFFVAIFGEQRWILITGVILVLGGSPLAHSMLLSSFGAEKLDLMVAQSIEDWKSAPVYQFRKDQGLRLGSHEGKMTIVEFADYLCPHCKMAGPPLKAFAKTRSNVELIFKSFPLDKKCNDALKVEGDGLRCLLAYAVECAESEHKLGWSVQEKIFDRQASWSFENKDQQLREIFQGFGMNLEKMDVCMKAPETHQAILAQAAEGVAAQVQGTPTIYVNGQRLPAAQVLRVLQAAQKVVGN